nr:YbaB/EbfC family nucleoid-associated protein [uncultured Actinoplanes sp.]
MSREIDESWIGEAIERYKQFEQLQEEYDQTVASHLVSVHSPDDSIEVIVTAAGEITDIRIRGSLQNRNPAEFARELHEVVTGAADAARGAREKLHGEFFGKLRSLGKDR